jgi:secreted trypsin-like serine protease
MKKNTLVAVSLLSLFSLAACSQKAETSSASLSSQTPVAGIIDGETVSADEAIAKTTVIVYNQASGGLCTGSLIQNNLALTAAHCTFGASKGDLVVIFATSDADKNAEARRVLGGLVTEKYAEMMTQREEISKDWQDMSVIKFEGHDLPAGYQKAALLTGTKVLPKTETILLAGYGVNAIKPDPKSKSGYDGAGAGTLRKTSVTLKDADYSESEILVTMTNGQGACHGDSGGPAYLIRNGKITVAGVTSRADSETGAVECNGNTVYTSVPGMAGFIKQAAKYLESNDFQPGDIGYLKASGDSN